MSAIELADSLLWEQAGEPEPSGDVRVQRMRAVPRPPRVEHLAAFDDYGAAEGDVMQHRNIVPDHRGFSDHKSRGVIEENPAADFCRRINVALKHR